MKRYILGVWVLLLGCLTGRAQQAELIITFAGAITVENLEKEELFKRMLTFHQENMPEEALRQADKETGELKGTSFLRYTSSTTAASDLTKGYILYDFEVTVTENGFRYAMTNFRHEAKVKFHTITSYPNFPYKISAVEKPWYDLVWKDIKQQLSQQVPKLIDTMKEAAENGSYTAQIRNKEKTESVSRLVNSRANE